MSTEFSVGVCLGIGVEALVWAYCMGNDVSASERAAWFMFSLGASVAGCLVGFFSAGGDSK